MQGVSTVMPLAVSTGAGVLKSILSGNDDGAGGVSAAAEARAQGVEAQARRQAEAQERSAREQAEDLREQGQHKGAAARVAAATSGLALSGSSLLSLEAQEQADDERIGRLLGDAAVSAQGTLDRGAEQARSIRLSGRTTQNRAGGLGSLLRLGGQSLENDWPSTFLR